MKIFYYFMKNEGIGVILTHFHRVNMNKTIGHFTKFRLFVFYLKQTDGNHI